MAKPTIALSTSPIFEPYCYELLRKISLELSRNEIASTFTFSTQQPHSSSSTSSALAVVCEDATTEPAPIHIKITGFHGKIILTTDVHREIALSLEHLIMRGHQRIALFCRAVQDFNAEERIREFTDQCSRNSHIVDYQVYSAAPDSDSIASTAQSLLDHHPTAVICSSDFLATSLLYEAHQRNISVPKDLSVIGYSDVPEAAKTIPALTTIRLPFTRLARAVSQITTDIMLTGTSRIGNITFRPELIIRNSTSHARS